MCHRTDSSDLANPVEGSVPKGSSLVSHDLSPDDWVRGLKPGDALKFVELLDEVLRTGRLDDDHRPQCVHHLARVCWWHGILPNSARISNHERNHTVPDRRDSFSTIWLGTYNGRKVDIREQDFYLSYDEKTKRSIARDFCKEAVIWKHLTHPNIVPFLGAAMVTEGGRQTWEIVSEPMENGRIEDFLKLNQGVNKLELLKDVAAGLSYLHSQGVVHGDLKLKGSNILINKHGHACLVNFGIPPPFPGPTRGSDYNHEILCWYVSPGDEHGTKESDVYALGILIYEIICGYKPHHQATGHPAMLKLHQGDFPAKPEVGFTDSLWRIIERCWHGQPEARPSAHAVMDVLDEALRG